MPRIFPLLKQSFFLLQEQYSLCQEKKMVLLYIKNKDLGIRKRFCRWMKNAKVKRTTEGWAFS